MKTKLKGILTLFLALAVQIAFAQQTVTGKVTDPTGDPVLGATVLVKGSSNATTTDFDGNYSIQASPQDILQISYAGYPTQEITVGNQSTINVAFSGELDVIVLTGSIFDVGEQRENGVSSMGAEELRATVGPVPIDRAMQGQMSGVNVTAASTAPGRAANVQVRGAFSPTGGLQDPLYVVDGTYMNVGDLPAINSANIESLQVLTDASQTALYGSRGANGVVVITTKKGTSGKPRVTLSTRYGTTNRFPIRVDLMNSRQKLEYENALSTITDGLGNPLGLGRARTAQEINDAAATNVDWSDELLQTGITESYNIAIASGSENSTNRFALGYDSDTGITRGYDGFQRISASLNNTTKVSKKFNFGYNVNGSYSERDDPRDRRNVQSPFWSEIFNNPYQPLRNDDGTFNISGQLNSFGYQVLDEIFGTDQQVRNMRLFGSGFAEYFILNDLKVRTQFGAVYDRTQTENFLRPSARLNSFIGTQGTKTDNSIDDLDYNWRNEISYGKTFKDVHTVKVTAATEFQSENFYRVSLQSQTFPNDFQNTQNLAGLIEQGSFSDRSRVTRTGVLGVINYSYDNKYNFNGYVRRDGSSLAGFDNQYGTFFGASASWNIAKESFMDDVTAVKSLLFSASYGTLGDDSVLGVYSNFTSIGATGLYGADPAALPSFTIANRNVTWETNEKINLGVAFELFQGSALRGKIDYFIDTRKDFIFQDIFATEAGSFNGLNNFGDSRVSGLEVDLSYDVLRNNDGLNLTLFGNITTLDYEITSLADEQIRGYSGGQVITTEGQEPFTQYLVRYAGVNPANGDALYLDADGNLTNVFSAENAVAIEGKSSLPNVFGGFGMRTEYKGFDMSANFNFSLGNWVMNSQSSQLHDPSNWRNNRVVSATNYWQQPGDTNVLARPTLNGIEANTTQFLQDASYLAFRNLTLGYTFSDKALGNTGINSIRAYVQAQNLAIWSGFEGNPEVGIGSSEDNAPPQTSNSVYLFSYPQVQSFSLGFDINF